MKNEHEVLIEQQITNISVMDLVDILSHITKPTFCNIVTETKVRMNKTNNPYYNLITKKSSQNIMIGVNYENRVNNNLEKENKERNFEVSENKVGQHLSKVVLYNENTDKYYLQYERFDEVKNNKSEYIYNGNPIEKTLFESFMVKSNGYKNQNTDKEVKIMSVTISNIKQITLNGQKYRVIE